MTSTATPRVSIVIPAHDPDPRFLSKALHSIVAQTLHEWEAVVIDDCSTESLEWCKDIDPRISLIQLERRSLPGLARNRGIEATQGPYIAFLDSDDEWRPYKLERQLAALDSSPKSVLSSTDFVHIDLDGKVVGPGYVGHNRTYHDLLGGCGIILSSVVVRRSAIVQVGPFMPLSTSEDWELWLRLAMYGEFLTDNDVLTLYRVHPDNRSKHYERRIEEATRFLEMHRLRASTIGDTESMAVANLGIRALYDRTAAQAIAEARRSARQGQPLPAIRHLTRAFSYSPHITARELITWARSRFRHQ